MTAGELELTARLAALAAGGKDLVARLCAALRQQIAEGRIVPGTRLPSEIELARIMRVSRPTLREATRILAQEGLLEIRHGVGTFVVASTPHITNPLDTMLSFSAAIRAAGGEPGVSSMTIERVAAPRDIARGLALPAKTEVVRIRRVRLMDDRPVSLGLEYLPLAAPVTVDAIQRFDGGSLYDFLRTTLGLELLRSEVAVAAVSANAQQSRLLSMRPGAPLLMMRELHFGRGDRRVLYSINGHNSAVVELTLVRAGVRT